MSFVVRSNAWWKIDASAEASYVLCGDFNQSSERFAIDGRGKQCTAISFVAVVKMMISRNMERWVAYNINKTLIDGDSFFREICRLRYRGTLQPLLHGDIFSMAEYATADRCPTEILQVRANLVKQTCYSGLLGSNEREDIIVNIRNSFASINSGEQRVDPLSRSSCDDCSEYGIYGDLTNVANAENGQLVSDIHSLSDLFSMLVTGGENALLSIEDYTFGIHAQNSALYLFDSHSRDAQGYVSPNGTAILLEFHSAKRCEQFLRRHSDQLAPSVDLCVPSAKRPRRKSNRRCSTSTTAVRAVNTIRLCDTVDDTDSNTQCTDDDTMCTTDDCTLEYTESHTLAAETLTEQTLDVLNTVGSRTTYNNKNRVSRKPNGFSVNDVILRSDSDENESEFMHSVARVSDQSCQSDINSGNLGSGSSSVIVEQYPVLDKIKQYNEEAIPRSTQRSLPDSFTSFHKKIRKRLNRACEVCAKLLFEDQIHKIRLNEQILEFMCSYYSNGSVICVCDRCKGWIANRKQLPAHAVINNLELDKVPPELQNLKIFERRFVSKINCFYTLIVLPYGQLSQEGMALYVPNELDEILQQLPIRSSPGGLVIVNRAGVNSNAYQYVRWSAILAALLWLRANNPLYRDLQIQTDIRAFVQHSEDALENLIESGVCNLSTNIPDISPEEYMRKSGCPVYELNRTDRPPIVFTERVHAEALTFPWLYPNGGYDLSTPRNRRLTIRDYFQSRLLNFDTRFRQDLSYLFHANNLMETRDLFDTVNVYMRIMKPLSSNSIQNTADSVGQQHRITAGDLQSVELGSDLRNNSYMYTKKIHGTPAYWKDQLYDLLARVRLQGPPDIFMTLSADDMHWPELNQMMQDEYERFCNDKEAFNENIRSHPVLAALHFERRWKALLYSVLLKGEQPLGKVKDFYWRIEFQNRGSAHLHIFFWIENAPSFEKHSTAEEFKQYINRIMSSVLPDTNENTEMHDLVLRLQTHNHTPSCSRPGGCRFDFPRRECAETRILYLSEATSRRNRRFYETKRPPDSVNINCYNPVILKYWQANMDIQLVNGASGLAYYVCKYAVKAEPEALKRALAALANQSELTRSLDKRNSLIRLGMLVLKSRQLSAQEAAFRSLGLDLVGSSRAVVRVSTVPPTNRFELLKPWSNISALDPSSTEIFHDGSLQHYHKRPANLENSSYFHILSEYRIANTLQPDGERKLTFKKRRKPCCVRSTYMSPVNENYYYGMLLLHLPHRDESELLQGYNNVRHAFLSKYTMFDTSHMINENCLQEILQNVERLRAICFVLEQADEEANLSAAAAADPVVTDQQLTDFVNSSTSTGASSRHDIGDDEIQTATETDIDWHHLTVCGATSASDINNRIAMLTSDQRNAFQYVVQNVKSQVLLFITGEAGCGKSFLLRVLVDWLRLTQCTVSGIDCVAVCAPTGIAAKNIQGTTIHSLLRLPLQQGAEPTYTTLSGKSLQFVRNTMTGIMYVIIDEISMVSKNMLHTIHMRLCNVSGKSDKPFGGYSIILYGDFFQLPPIRADYAFNAKPLWDLFRCIYLKQNVRQQNDQAFISLLNSVRVGYLSQTHIDLLHARLMPDQYAYPDVIRLFPTLKQTDEYNRWRQNQISNNIASLQSQDLYSKYDAHPGCEADEQCIPNLDRYAGGLPRNLLLSVGTRVMLIKNLGDGLVNGSTGIVKEFEYTNNSSIRKVNEICVEFDDPNAGNFWKSSTTDNYVRIQRYPQEYFNRGRHIVRTQFPLVPAWAISIHKSQGLTLSRAVISLGKHLFANGQAYVALSRVKSLDGLFLTDLVINRIKADIKVLEFDVKLRRQCAGLNSSSTTSVTNI